MYATGDIVRRLTPDTYQFIGRKDLMVKCAGFRVELQEIENVLDRHETVREAVVVPCYREERGSVALHAYIALKPGMRATITELKKYCGDALPRYMVPEAVHILEELPRNPNGKIDRQLLLDRCHAAADNKGGI
jgi:acyl-coenzyme A synthetase/AMP-(fatty) acid ligase